MIKATQLLLISILFLSAFSSLQAKELDLNNLAFPWGKSVEEVSQNYNIISKPNFVFDTLWNNYISDIDKIGSADIKGNFSFYNGILHSIYIEFDNNDSTEILNHLKIRYGSPIKFKEEDDINISEYYWFPNENTILEYSIFGPTLKIISVEQMIAKMDVKRDKRRRFSNQKNKFDVRRVMWGMTKEEVKSSEKRIVFGEDNSDMIESLIYLDSLFGETVSVRYDFIQNRLFRSGIYFLFLKNNTVTKKASTFNGAKSKYISKYGNPKSCFPAFVESHKVRKNDLDMHSVIGCEWEYKPNIHNDIVYQEYSIITLNVSNDGVGSMYLSTSYADLLKFKKLKKDLDKF